jgi:hypothetical protein
MKEMWQQTRYTISHPGERKILKQPEKPVSDLPVFQNILPPGSGEILFMLPLKQKRIPEYEWIKTT